MQVVLGHNRLFRAGSMEWEEDRKTDVFLYYTQSIDGTEKIRLPKRYALDGPVGSDEIDETYAYFKGTGRMDKGDLVITQKAEVRRRQIPPDGYGGFLSAIEEAREWGEQVFRVVKGGK
ncbi:MAG TPA: hypothetical protein VLA34_06990, partial [Candidatus Krumholzibacterium sp.]|nr:hypothetical protein [Candidatus Krumholzibacterium sp.]